LGRRSFPSVVPQKPGRFYWRLKWTEWW
jgi:hypothetical protein